MPNLDVVDRQILQRLRANGRISNVELAEAVGLSPSACLRRVKLMERSGRIRGYTAIVDSGEGGGIVVIVQITLERQTEEAFDRFEKAVRRHAEIRECYLMTGGADYLIRVEADSAADYEKIHKEILSRLPGISRINSSFAIRRVVTGR